jgi:hypothetical protein
MSLPRRDTDPPDWGNPPCAAGSIARSRLLFHSVSPRVFGALEPPSRATHPTRTGAPSVRSRFHRGFAHINALCQRAFSRRRSRPCPFSAGPPRARGSRLRSPAYAGCRHSVRRSSATRAGIGRRMAHDHLLFPVFTGTGSALPMPRRNRLSSLLCFYDETAMVPRRCSRCNRPRVREGRPPCFRRAPALAEAGVSLSSQRCSPTRPSHS